MGELLPFAWGAGHSRPFASTPTSSSVGLQPPRRSDEQDPATQADRLATAAAGTDDAAAEAEVMPRYCATCPYILPESWNRRVCANCIRRRVNKDEQEARERAEALARAPHPRSLSAPQWHDSSSGNRWGARPRNQVVPRTWGGGNCLKGCIASILSAPIERVPDPSREFNSNPEGWLGRYSQRLAKQTGYRLDKLPASICPPKNPNALWIATTDERPGPADHCVVARGAWVVHDPSGMYSGALPLDRLADGLLVVPTRRVVPVLSPLGSGRTVVAA